MSVITLQKVRCDGRDEAGKPCLKEEPQPSPELRWWLVATVKVSLGDALLNKDYCSVECLARRVAEYVQRRKEAEERTR